jgi:hypothetical protein
VSFASAGCPISFRICPIYLSEIRIKNGDCSSHHDKSYNRVYFISCSLEDLGQTEEFFITLFRPKYNVYRLQNISSDAVVVARCLNISVNAAKDLLTQSRGHDRRHVLLDFLADGANRKLVGDWRAPWGLAEWLSSEAVA